MGKIDPELFEKYFNNRLNAAELEALQHYLQLSDLSELESYMAKAWKEKAGRQQPLTNPLQDDIWEKIRPQLTPRPKIQFRRSGSVLRIAAAIALLILGATVVFWLNGPDGNIGTRLSNNSLKVDRIRLPDGSQVWLNRNSEISYGPEFGDSTRSVHLIGEAFFEVEKDSLHPFIVHTTSVSTKVLGTSFNVQAIKKSNQVKVALMEGKVQVKVNSPDGTSPSLKDLSPGELLIYDKSRDTTLIDQYSADFPYAWKRGSIQFDGANIHEVITVLAHWYDLKFTIQGDTAKMTTELVHRYDANSLTLQEVLNGIGSVADYQFEQIDERTYVVRPD